MAKNSQKKGFERYELNVPSHLFNVIFAVKRLQDVLTGVRIMNKRVSL